MLMFNFVKVINRNAVSFFYFGYNNNCIFDDVKITSAPASDIAV